MKIQHSNPCSRNGIMLIECLVYIVVFSILIATGFEAFYKCWDNSNRLGYATDEVAKAMNAGERWRDDVRNATGRITISTTANGQTVRIPQGKNSVLYVLNAGELRRKTSASEAVILATVKTSRMEPSQRITSHAWRWELEISPRRYKSRMPLLFTFMAVAPISP